MDTPFWRRNKQEPLCRRPSVIVMAPADGSVDQAGSVLVRDIRRDFDATTTSSASNASVVHTFRRINRLSLSKRRHTINILDVNISSRSRNDEAKRKSGDALLTSVEQQSPKRTRVEDQATMNGHHHKILDSGRFSASASSGTKSNASSGGSNTPLASLCNLGNTCFLNSVLYTLRFTPGFLHNLHHLVVDLGIGNGTSSGSSSGKDKKNRSNGSNNGSTNNGITDAETELVHDVIEQLHDLFRNMSTCDDHLAEKESSSSNSSKEPIPPSNFLNSVGKFNPLFEGNQQQDAHELLVMLLTMLQDIKIPTAPTCSSVVADEESAAVAGEVGSAKKAEKKKSKKSFLMSNGHSNNNGNSGVKLLSATTKADAGGGPQPTEQQPQKSVQPPPADQPDSLPNFVRENFVGKTVFRTKCLECETCTYRSEKFTNIDIPLTFDDDVSESMSNGSVKEDNSNGVGGTLSVVDLFLKQIMASETLRENNKYLCAECSRLNEAQRSVQYELLPKVLVLQLKRFTATCNKSAFMSKINDYIPTPFTMNCFCTQCMPPDAHHFPGDQLPLQPKHHYRLFAVIMHLGATLASGHYIAYVRASTDLNIEYGQCLRASQFTNSAERHKNGVGSASGGSGNGGKKGIMKYFSRSSDSSRNGPTTSSNTSLSSAVSANGKDAGATEVGNGQQAACRSANCCGMQRVLCQLNNRDPPGQPGARQRRRSQESLDSSNMNGHGASETDSPAPGSSSSSSGQMDDLWLECDDENISVITRRQFEDELNSKQSATTPYLLFYERI
jgi:ubiquitin carboxyl-terminal hydrolase 1